MKSLFVWASKNVALSFLLGLETFCLLLGLGWVLSHHVGNSAEDIHSKEVLAPVSQVWVITDEEQTDYVSTGMEVLSSSKNVDYKMVSTNRENAISEFNKHPNAILILSEPLNDLEIAAVHPNRHPLKQSVIDHSDSTRNTLPIFVRDNHSSSEENTIAAFLDNNTSQDVVLQKMKIKQAKKPTRVG